MHESNWRQAKRTLAEVTDWNDAAWHVMDRVYKRVQELWPSAVNSTCWYDFGVPIIADALKAAAAHGSLGVDSDTRCTCGGIMFGDGNAHAPKCPAYVGSKPTESHQNNASA